MRHRKKRSRLSRTTSERSACLNSLVQSLITYQRIKTTLVKAKEAKKIADSLIDRTKEQNSIHAKRLAFKVLRNRDLVKKLFDQISPLFEKKEGGYTRIMHLGTRLGDGAQMVIFELTKKVDIKKKGHKSQKEKQDEQVAKDKKSKPETKTDEQQPGTEPKKEKPQPENKKENLRPEKSHKTGFLKNLKKYIRPKTEM